MKSKSFKKYFDDLDDFDKLKTAPKGYPKDHENIHLLQHKSFVVSHAFTDTQVTDKKFVKNLAAVCKEIMPLNTFLKEAIS